jgi:D-arabinose 1-dehydrogenase-like Zn-dependent alcohol dehydrogenase
MRAMLLDEAAEPEAAPGQLKPRVEACGACRTDLHLRDGELAPGHLPVVLGTGREEFLALTPRVPVRTTVTAFALAEAETALDRLRARAIEGAAVVVPPS